MSERKSAHDAPVIATPPTDIDGSAPIAEGTPQPAPRVAPTPSIAPPPEAEEAPERVEATIPDEQAPPEDVVEETEPAAPPEASDRIVTEAEETPELAPASSMRPRSRPARPVRQADAEEEAPSRDPVEDAVAEALETPEPSAPRGPPLTGGEKDAFSFAVSRCWRVDTGGRSAGVSVVVSFELDRQGRVIGDQVTLVSSTEPGSSAERAAYDRARIAILRCQSGGYELPLEKYEQWREVEVTFNPEGMQFR